LTTSALAFSELLPLLRRRADDPAVVRLIERDPSQIERSDYYGFVEFRDGGVSVMFQEAAFVLGSSQVGDRTALLLAAFHLHRRGHEGYEQYGGELPHGVAFGDAEADVVTKVGSPAEKGGGGMSRVLKKPIPRWLRYHVGDATLQYQLDDDGRVEMATLAMPPPPNL
jgi:hypothetical protein